MSGRVLQTLVEGGAFFESPRWHEGRWWVSDFYRRLVLTVDPQGATEEQSDASRGSRRAWAGCPTARCSSSRCATTASCAGRPATDATRARRRQRVLRRAPQRHGRRRARPRVRGELRLRPHGRRRPGARGADPRRPGRHGVRRRRGPALPQRLGHHPRRADADRRRDGRRPLHGVHHRGRRRADRPPRVGAGRADAASSPRSRRRWASCSSAPTAARWTPRATSGPPTRSARAACASRPGGEIVDEIAAPDGLDVFACMLGGDDGRTLLMCAAPDFGEANRSAAHEAVLLTATVDVPHAGLP